MKDDYVDGMRLFEDITFRDSMGHTFYAIPDGSYLFRTDETEEIRGEYWRISDGKMTEM